jgi:hypothetical protein
MHVAVQNSDIPGISAAGSFFDQEYNLRRWFSKMAAFPAFQLLFLMSEM